MTTILAPTAQPPASTASPAHTRYIADVLRQEEKLSLKGILSAPMRDRHICVVHDDQLSTVAVRDDLLPFRYRLAVSAFRLAQYLQLSWLDTTAVFENALFHEPDCGRVPDNSVHVITIDQRSGTIVGYVALFGQKATSGDSLVSDPLRDLFPCELVHRVRLFDVLPVDPIPRVGQVWEVKRLVQRSSNASDRHLKMATTLHQFSGIFTVLNALGDDARWLIGDAQEHVAIKQLRMTVRELSVIEGTNPFLPFEDLYWPAYTVRKDVKPFMARVPQDEEMMTLLSDLRRALDSPDLGEKLRILKNRTIDEVRRVSL